MSAFLVSASVLRSVLVAGLDVVVGGSSGLGQVIIAKVPDTVDSESRPPK